jgi:hypothetical protein
MIGQPVILPHGLRMVRKITVLIKLMRSVRSLPTHRKAAARG